MSPGILEIVKGKDDEEDLDYLEIEIYKDWNFWKGLGIPMFCVLMGFFGWLLSTVTILDIWKMLVIFSVLEFFFCAPSFAFGHYWV